MKFRSFEEQQMKRNIYIYIYTQHTYIHTYVTKNGVSSFKGLHRTGEYARTPTDTYIADHSLAIRRFLELMLYPYLYRINVASIFFFSFRGYVPSPVPYTDRTPGNVSPLDTDNELIVPQQSFFLSVFTSISISIMHMYKYAVRAEYNRCPRANSYNVPF